MASQLDRLQSQLLQTGLQQRDQPLWQVIDQLIKTLRASNIQIQDIAEGGGGNAGITNLVGDVVANGPGVAIATIQPDAVTTPKIIDDAIITDKILDNNVTYGKIQQVTQPSVLLGNDEVSAPANVKEIGLGENLEILDGTLEINIPEDEGGEGTVGIRHRVLSGVHFDSLPAVPIFGDLIAAGEGTEILPSFFEGGMKAHVNEDFIGTRAAYTLGFGNNPLPIGRVGWGAPPPYSYVEVEIPKLYAEPDEIDACIIANIVEDFIGVRGAYYGPATNSGNVQAMTGNGLAFIELNVEPPTVAPLWQRLPVGTAGQIIQPINGFPTWRDDLDLAGDLVVDGDVDINGDLDAINAVMTLQSLIALASVSSPLFNGNPLGAWVDVTFDAGNFTANGGTTPTWTLVIGDQVVFRYYYIGSGVMRVQIYLQETTVASAAGDVTRLEILIPDGQSCIGIFYKQMGIQENGTAVYDAVVGYDSTIDATKIFIRKYPLAAAIPFDQTANGSYFGFDLDIRIA